MAAEAIVEGVNPFPFKHAKPAEREIELKFLASEQDFKAAQNSELLGSHGGLGKVERLKSTYFDTETRDLQRHKMVLRMRKRGKSYVMGLKSSASESQGPFDRGEIEIASSSPLPDLDLFGKDVADEIAGLTAGRTLQPCYATDIKRNAYQLATETAEIEVAFDTGFIVAGDSKQPVREIELELKSGDTADLYRLGLKLVEAFPMRLGVMSKSERGALLSSGTCVTATRPQSPVSKEQSVDEAISAIIGACIGQFTANWTAFETGDEVDAVHQMRVSLRRLRTALAFIHREFPCAELEELRAAAKEVAGAMGEARNWDVFTARVHDGPASFMTSESGFATLIEAASEQRNAGYDAVRSLLADSRTTRFVLSVQALVAEHGWRNALSGAELPKLTAPVVSFASPCLAYLHKRVRKRGRGLAHLSPEARHKVRIALKNLRYAVDFFADLFPGSKPYSRAVAQLQDVLGGLNDIEMIRDLVQRLDTQSDAKCARAAGIVLGWYSHGEQIGHADMKKVWSALREAKRFWA